MRFVLICLIFSYWLHKRKLAHQKTAGSEGPESYPPFLEAQPRPNPARGFGQGMSAALTPAFTCNDLETPCGPWPFALSAIPVWSGW